MEPFGNLSDIQKDVEMPNINMAPDSMGGVGAISGQA
jgi:hypothetical protein